MKMPAVIALVSALSLCNFIPWASAVGPYSGALNDPDNPYDAPVPLTLGPDGSGIVFSVGSANWINPAFASWASSVVSYAPAYDVDSPWTDFTRALGPATGNHINVVSLGELEQSHIDANEPPGSITLAFPVPIRNFPGADFAVFENAFVSDGGPGAGVAGEILGELAYVEVSSDGQHFARFPSHSLTPDPVGPYGTIDPRNIHGLAGKHVNANGISWGTPFDLSTLEDDLLVQAGLVDLDAIHFVRIVDIPGSGDFTDSFGNPVFDAWPTWGSAGFDLEAVGVISAELSYPAWLALNNLEGASAETLSDPDQDGIVNLLEYAFATSPVHARSRAEPRIEWVQGHAAIVFKRDLRKTDLILTVETSDDMRNWAALAVSSHGQPLVPANGRTPLIHEESASREASVRVIRRVTVTDDQAVSAGARFLRVRVTLDSEL